MKMTKRKTGWAIFAASLLLLSSETSLTAAQGAAYNFWRSFFPAMLPFFLLGPYLAGEDAQRAFGRLFGRALPGLFGVPGEGAGAVLCGWIAGTPAGALGCAQAGQGMRQGEYARMCLLSCGLSPAFLITAVGEGALGRPEAGWMLFAAQGFALVSAGLLLRRWEPACAIERRGESAAAQGDIFLSALANMGKVLCWMVVFAVAGALAEEWLGGLVPGWLLAPVLEISGGAARLAQAPLEEDARLIALAACAGFGGLCVQLQCAQACGLPLRVLFAGKALHGLLGAGAMWAMLHAEELLRWPTVRADPFTAGTLCALLLAALAFCLGRARGNKKESGAGQSPAG